MTVRIWKLWYPINCEETFVAKDFDDAVQKAKARMKQMAENRHKSEPEELLGVSLVLQTDD